MTETSSRRLIKGDGVKVIAEQEEPIDLENIVVRLDSPKIKLTLGEKSEGLVIYFSIDDFGSGDFNEQPYTTQDTANKHYRYLLKQIRLGNYTLELHEKKNLKLRLKHPIIENLKLF
ncbi:MAG: hypothetical protein AABX59_03335 [Nanoarchaeota archaeon]